ncbi:hypothetical protein [Klenkia brasiliensis]|uniref:Fis family transcriptional regulator n=1 Tax=Klenkia brasiliensis TaxID=333142 RepID=A0A1G7WAQ9_9ACTN|nr:hypothetical protein [Klenkia brasiliensis]SDG69093.1 hypothetical protein SAMN05660324_3258 [Klenkia brasiliensis]
MRWEQLFADLEAAFAAEQAAAEDLASRTRAEVGAVRLADRLRGSTGRDVALDCAGAGRVAGRLVDVGSDWVLLAAERGQELLVATGCLRAVGGLGPVTAPADEPGVVARSWDLRRAVRGLARDRAAVRCVLQDGTVLTGTVDRVGADFLELAEHHLDQPRRRTAVTSVRAVVLGAVALLASPGAG